jgi:hypothetical protein
VKLQLPASTSDTSNTKGTIIDSGTTLAYLPEAVHKDLMAAVWNILSETFISIEEQFVLITWRFLNHL